MAAAQRPARLTAKFVENVTEPGRYSDGRGANGLSLLVRETSDGRIAKVWSQRITIDKKQTNLGLGSYPVVTLAEARERALDNRRAVHSGGDPRAAESPTFEEAAEAVIAFRRGGWDDKGRSEAQWSHSLRCHAFPLIGGKKVGEVSTADVLGVLMPIWHDKPETARRVRNRIKTIMAWAIANGHRADNPAGDSLTPVLPRHNTRKKHFAAVHHSDVKAAVDAVKASRAMEATKLAFEFQVLTAARSGEVLAATWAEIDFGAAEWSISAERMKARNPHRVPLSPRALEVLDEARALSRGAGLVFPSPRGKMLSNGTLSKLMKDLGVQAVPHGFRSSFRDWCADTGVPREVAEAALAHTVGGVEGAYKRTDLYDRRRPVMDDWAAYLS